MKLVMPDPVGRGAGLGNELIYWAKAIIAAQTLGARALHPAWGINKRKYYRYFRTSRLDWLWYRILKRVLPSFHFDEAAYLAHGGDDYARAIASFAKAKGLDKRRAYVLTVDGLWGGLDILAPARLPLLAQLLNASHVTDNLYKIETAIPSGKLRVAMHVRRGDFAAVQAGSEIRGKFNVGLPLDWYIAVARSLAAALGDDVHFLVLSDASAAELAPLLSVMPQATMTDDHVMSDISDLLAMSYCDFAVCSVSSFSMWAVFSSTMRYAWYAPHLSPVDSFAGIWTHQDSQQDPASATGRALSAMQARVEAGGEICARGVPVDDDGVLPGETLAWLRQLASLKQRESDLIRYGVVPATSS